MTENKRFQRSPPNFLPFKEVEIQRPPASEPNWLVTQTLNPTWVPGQGAGPNNDWKARKTVEIDPEDVGRDPIDNYTLLISGIVPRPIALISTVSKDGVLNVSPYSYLGLMNHDPPVFTLGCAGGSRLPRDTWRNIIDTKECVISMVSEDFIEAADFTSIDTPHGVSEWPLSGLHQAPSKVVKPPLVAESRFSVECKLVHQYEIFNKIEKICTGGVLILEGVRFHVAEAALNEDHINIAPDVLRPVARLGGIMYGRTIQGFELPKHAYKDHTEPTIN